jgi:hypothetical protein
MSSIEREAINKEMVNETRKKFLATKMSDVNSGLEYMLKAFIPVSGDALVLDAYRCFQNKPLSSSMKIQYAAFIAGKYVLFTSLGVSLGKLL